MNTSYVLVEDTFVLEHLPTNVTINLLPGVQYHVQWHGALLDLFTTNRAYNFWHRVMLQVEVESFLRDEPLVAVLAGTGVVLHVLRVGHHVLLHTLLGLVLRATQVADVELGPV